MPTYHLSLACNHCADAPCREACPALAIAKDAATGIVKIDAGKCLGCRYCTWACPYGALRYDEAASVMTKCTFCDHRLAEGLEPACVTACPTGALTRGDLDRLPGADRVPGFTDTRVRPSVRFAPLRGEGTAPESSLAPPPPGDAPPPPGGLLLPPGGFPDADEAPAITPRGEWPLLVFTLLAAVLAGWLLAARLAPVGVSPAAFLVLGAAGMAVSTLHLGRKERAWRAVLNLRRSWLSREIAGYGAFFGTGLLWFVAGSPAPWGWVPVLLGLGTLLAMDRVYDPVRAGGARPVHSADVLLTGLLVAGVLAHLAVLAGALALVKTALYLRRKLRFADAGEPPRAAAGALRIGLGVLAPALLWTVAPAGGLLVLVLAGEVGDRVEFYLELRVRTPRDRVRRDLDAQVQFQSDQALLDRAPGIV